MNPKNESIDKTTARPNLDRFKYEVAQEMGLSTRKKSVSKNNEQIKKPQA